MQHWQISRPDLERCFEHAREERARALQRWVRAGAAGLARAVRATAAALARRLRVNATVRKLGALEERLLDDIGITRAEIADLAQGRIQPRRARAATARAEPPATELAIDPADALKQPLTAILSISEILRDNPDLPRVRRQEFLGIVIAESERLDRAIDEVLNPPRAA